MIRGNSPTGVLWRLEGIPIPNPNHFSTTGTTGGPVSALNPNVIKNSDFLTSAFPAEYGNALSGVFDVGFRNGNKDKHEFTAQLGAITGIEAMAEGPIAQKNNGSYLVAARYSFLGLATELGLPIGTNATPNYRDISFHINLGKTGVGKVSLFGIGGTSNIDFLHDEVDNQDLFSAEDEDQFVTSRFGVIGLKHNLLLDDRTYWRTIIAASTTGLTFEQDRYLSLDQPDETIRRIREADNTENRFTISSFINRKINARLSTRFGVLFERYSYDLFDRQREFTPEWIPINIFKESTNLIQGFWQNQWKISKKITLNLGLHTQYLALNEDFLWEPRVAVNYKVSKNQTLSLGYGIHGQIVPLPILLASEQVADGVFEETNLQLRATRSQHFVLGYDISLGADWRGKAELYYQDIDRVPVDPFPSPFSLLNEGADFTFADDQVGLVNEGTGRNYGIEITLEKFFSKGYYLLFTNSLYQSKYTGSDGVERNTAFNNQFVLNVLTGREIQLGKRSAFTIDTKVTTAGGRFFTPVDLEASRTIGQEVLDLENAFSDQYRTYFRWDIKFGIKLNSASKKLSQQFFFDIQNITNTENIFVRRYNRLTNEVNEVLQIGFFPNFLYRLQF